MSQPEEHRRVIELEKLNLAQRILEVYRIVDGVRKDRHVKQGNEGYKAVTHDAVSALLHMPLAVHGILIVPTMSAFEVDSFEKEKFYNGKAEGKTTWYKVRVQIDATFMNADRPEDRFVSTAYAYAMDTSDKAMGKAYSLAYKTILLKVFMLESHDREEDREFENEGPGGWDDPPPPKKPAAKPKAAAPAKPAAAEPPSPTPPPAPKKAVEAPQKPTEEEIKEIFRITSIPGAKWNTNDVKSYLDALKLNSTKELNRTQYTALIALIKTTFFATWARNEAQKSQGR